MRFGLDRGERHDKLADISDICDSFSLVGSWLTHRHQGSTAFIEDPYEAGVFEENGKLRRRNLHVSFAELLYDLSVRAF